MKKKPPAKQSKKSNGKARAPKQEVKKPDKPDVQPARPLRVRKGRESAEEPPVVHKAPPPIKKRPVGRPTVYSDKLRVEICRRLAKGQSLRRICADPHIPNIDTVLSWALDEKHEFSEHYARARRIQAEMLVDDVITIADDSANDIVTDDKGNERVNTEAIQRAKLRIDSRKWLAVKLLPKVYGEKVEVTAPAEPEKEPETPEQKQERARRTLKKWGANTFAPKDIHGEEVDG